VGGIGVGDLTYAQHKVTAEVRHRSNKSLAQIRKQRSSNLRNELHTNKQDTEKKSTCAA